MIEYTETEEGLLFKALSHTYQAIDALNYDEPDYFQKFKNVFPNLHREDKELILEFMKKILNEKRERLIKDLKELIWSRN